MFFYDLYSALICSSESSWESQILHMFCAASLYYFCVVFCLKFKISFHLSAVLFHRQSRCLNSDCFYDIHGSQAFAKTAWFVLAQIVFTIMVAVLLDSLPPLHGLKHTLHLCISYRPGAWKFRNDAEYFFCDESSASPSKKVHIYTSPLKSRTCSDIPVCFISWNILYFCLYWASKTLLAPSAALFLLYSYEVLRYF